jgi:phenylacetate-CoA ligase
MALNLFDWALRIQSYPMQRARRDLQTLQQLPKTDFIQWQNRQRRDIARHHFENNPVYRSLFKNNPFPNRWEDLPLVQKKHLQGDLNQLVTAPCRRSQLHIGNTSGSSGHPFFYVKDKYAHAMTHALIAERYARHQLSPTMKQARFYGIPLEGRSRRIEQLKDVVANRVRFPVFDLSDERLALYLEHFSRTKFELIYGYASALRQFARFINQQSLTLADICPTLRACITTSEMCTPEDQALLARAFGAPVLNEYGVSELDIMAFPDQNGDWILSNENLFFEVLDDAGQLLPEGREGRIFVTALHNRAFPMVRYEPGDRGVIADGKLLQLSGRSNDLIELPSGKTAAGLTFYYIARSLLESGSDLKEFIIRQTAPDTFEMDVVSALPLQAKTIEQIRSAMDLYLEKGLQLLVHPVERIERPASGKIRHFYRQF